MLGEKPKDDLWFDHDDGIKRRVPPGWAFPRLGIEQMYVLYHCTSHLEGNPKIKISPMKLFRPNDVRHTGGHLKQGGKMMVTRLGELKRLCGIIDACCIKRGVEINGLMTEEDAKRCAHIGYNALGTARGYNPRRKVQGAFKDAIDAWKKMQDADKTGDCDGDPRAQAQKS